MEQVHDNMGALAVKARLSDDVMNRLEAILGTRPIDPDDAAAA